MALLAVMIAAPLLAAPRVAAAENNASMHTTAGAAAATGNAAPLRGACYSNAQPPITRGVKADAWTRWYEATATANCADLNVQVTNYPNNCSIAVDAEYYIASRDVWQPAAKGIINITNRVWSTPITNVRDGTKMRMSFNPSCADGSVTFRIAS